MEQLPLPRDIINYMKSFCCFHDKEQIIRKKRVLKIIKESSRCDYKLGKNFHWSLHTQEAVFSSSNCLLCGEFSFSRCNCLGPNLPKCFGCGLPHSGMSQYCSRNCFYY